MVADTHDICHVGDHHILLLADRGSVQSGRSCAERDDHHVKGMEISGYVWSDDMCHSGLLLAIRPVTRKKNEDIVMEAAGHRSVRRTIFSIAAMLVVIPLTIWFGCERLGDKNIILYLC